MRKVLIGDIGGTNARFALASEDSGSFIEIRTLQCAHFSNVIEAIRYYLDTIQSKAPEAICLAVAGPVVNQSVQFTNNPWSFTATELQQEFSCIHTYLLNDFEAIAHSIPCLQLFDLLNIGQSKGTELGHDYTIGIVGPGTGLGAVGLQNCNGVSKALMSEAGHTSFAPITPLQNQLLQVLQKSHTRVSNERLVSGPGIISLYNALCAIFGAKQETLSTADIFAEHAASNNEIASKTINLFYELLGQFAGDYTLSIGGFDGVYIAGGVAQRYPELLINSSFRTGFENKGRYTEIMVNTPTKLIVHPEPGLVGAASVARSLQRRT